jgi:hypothetical protein
MPLNLQEPRAGKSPHFTIHGAYLVVYVEKSPKTSNRRFAEKIPYAVRAA